MASRTFLPAISAALVMVASGLSAGGCAKRCETAAGCERTCPCTDRAADEPFDCTMIFNCDQESQTCDPEHGSDCAHICETYAAADACGRQCSNDEHCLLRCECADSSGREIVCRQAFACDRDIGVCEAAHRNASCDPICQACLSGIGP